MAQKMQYKTKQQEELLNFLKTMPGRHITAADICMHLRASGQTIGVTTVYRQLDHLVEKGLVGKYVIDGVNAACFAYIDPNENCHTPVCYHCKCENCGRLIHLECGELVALLAHMKEEHGFTVDPLRTVFYGLCSSCSTETENDETGPADCCADPAGGQKGGSHGSDTL